MLSDMNCELTKALGLTMDALGSVRCKRWVPAQWPVCVHYRGEAGWGPGFGRMSKA